MRECLQETLTLSTRRKRAAARTKRWLRKARLSPHNHTPTHTSYYTHPNNHTRIHAPIVTSIHHQVTSHTSYMIFIMICVPLSLLTAITRRVLPSPCLLPSCPLIHHLFTLTLTRTLCLPLSLPPSLSLSLTYTRARTHACTRTYDHITISFLEPQSLLWSHPRPRSQPSHHFALLTD